MAFIEGYGTTLAVTAGEDLPLHVSTDAKSFDVEILREGAETKSFGRVTSLPGVKHPVPELAFQKGCGWPVSHRLKTDSDWPSGVYRARLIADETTKSDIFFVLRSPRPGKTSPILMELCTNTYQAYHKWGGHSHYGYNSIGNMRSPLLSYHRPGIGWHSDTNATIWELPFIRWAEANGYTLDYAINSDLEFRPELLSSYRLMLSVGHDEYWSWGMRDTCENFVSNGGNIAFFTGNAVCWQIRYENDGLQQRCHKDASDEDPIFMLGDRRRLTTRWNHPLVGRPENTLTGVGWEGGGYHKSHGMIMDGSGAYTVKRAEHWI
ncbi:MAG TPA: N,N-dimethylformamidase beta subunit family domain-containing protein, partial [Planctomycetota bacterium]|nr:N,N-dimethylformamidase beta subunit family domain-containing protein [Planctomycetota bacterium]